MPLLHGDENYERKLRPIYDALDARSWKVIPSDAPMRVLSAAAASAAAATRPAPTRPFPLLAPG